MIYFNFMPLKRAVIMPCDFTQAQLLAPVHDQLGARLPGLLSFFLRKNWSGILQSPPDCDLLSRQCVFCAQSIEPNEMLSHHVLHHAFDKHYGHQFIEMWNKQHLTHAHCVCHTMQSLSDPATSCQLLKHNCPVVTQLAALCSAIVVRDIDGRIGSDERPGLLVPAAGDNGSPRTNAADQQGKYKRQRTQSGREETADRLLSSSAQPAPTHPLAENDEPPHQARGSAPKHRQAGLLHFFTTPGDAGIQPTLLQETNKWTQEMQNSNPPSTPLRLILIRAIFETLLERVQKISNMDRNSPAWSQTVSAQVALAILDMEPRQEQAGEINQTKGLSMKTLMETLQENRELLCAPSSVLRMQALKPPRGGGAIPLEASDWSARVQQCMALAPDDVPPSQCQEIQPGNDDSSEPDCRAQEPSCSEGERERQRQTIILTEPSMSFDRSAAREALCRILLRNPGDWRYLNATLTGLLWMLLRGPDEATHAELWGPHALNWKAVLTACAQAQEISLYALQAIAPLLRFWGEQPNQPCCAAEWGQFPLLSHS